MTPYFQNDRLLQIVLVVGLIPRLAYILLVPVTHDEYASLWAARHVIGHGIPRLPSGFVYWQGWLFTYLVAPLERLLSPAAMLLRFPGLVAGMVTIVLVYRIGLIFAGRPVGLIAALGWALTPVAIVAGGQARMYAFLDMFSLLAVLLLLRWMRHGQLADGWSFSVAVLGALASQAVALLLLPGLVLVALLQKGWRWWTRPVHWLPWGICAAGGAGTILLNRWGGPVSNAARRPYVAVSWPGDKTGLRLVMQELLGNAQGWLLVAGLLAGLFLLLRELRQRRAGPVTPLYALWVPGFLLFIVAVGESWQKVRYIQMLLPFVLLIAATVLWRCFARWGQGIMGWNRVGHTIPAVAGIALAVVWAMPVPVVIQTRGLDYQTAYALIRQQTMQQPAAPGGEREIVLTGLPVAAGYYLGQAGGYALQRDYQEYVVQNGEGWVDRWTGSPLIASAWDFGEAIAGVPGAWFVVSTDRLPMLYYPDFVAYLDEVMEPVLQQGGLTVYHTRPDRRKGIRAPLRATWSTGEGKRRAHISLIGYELERRRLSPGDTVQLALHWQTDRRIQENLAAFVHVVDRWGTGVAQTDRSPTGRILVTRWPVGQPVRGEFTLSLPADLRAGEYRLLVGLYKPETMERLSLEGHAVASSDNALTIDRLIVTVR